MVVDPMPLVGAARRCTAETLGQVMRRAARQMARGVDDGGEEQTIPGRLPFLGDLACAWFQGQTDRRGGAVALVEALPGVEGIGDVIDVGQLDCSLAQAGVDRVKR